MEDLLLRARISPVEGTTRISGVYHQDVIIEKTMVGEEEQGGVEALLRQEVIIVIEIEEMTGKELVVIEVNRFATSFVENLPLIFFSYPDYPREAPPLPRDDRMIRHAGPPPPRQEDNRRNRFTSPPRRAERDRQADEEPSRIRKGESVRSRRDPATDRVEGQEDGSGEDGEVQDDAEADMMAAMGFGGFGTTKVSGIQRLSGVK